MYLVFRPVLDGPFDQFCQLTLRFDRFAAVISFADPFCDASRAFSSPNRR